jgi:hypothetical protein
MEIAVIKLLTYGFIGIIIALFILIVSLALFLNNKIDRIKEER